MEIEKKEANAVIKLNCSRLACMKWLCGWARRAWADASTLVAWRNWWNAPCSFFIFVTLSHMLFTRCDSGTSGNICTREGTCCRWSIISPRLGSWWPLLVQLLIAFCCHKSVEAFLMCREWIAESKLTFIDGVGWSDGGQVPLPSLTRLRTSSVDIFRFITQQHATDLQILHNYPILTHFKYTANPSSV